MANYRTPPQIRLGTSGNDHSITQTDDVNDVTPLMLMYSKLLN